MRTREHVLEEESRLAFRTMLPAEWVIRDQVPDYGLDTQVEPFENSRALNTPFYAQLKGTDTDVADVRLKTERLRQYVEAPHPVLVVRYLSGSKTLLCDWAHRIVIRLEGSTPHWRFQESITVDLPQLLHRPAVPQLLEGVRQFYRARGGVASPPTLRLGLTLPLPQSPLSVAVVDGVANQLSVTGQRVILDDRNAELLVGTSADWSKVRVQYQTLDAEMPTTLSATPAAEDATAVIQVVNAMAVSLAGLRHDASRMLRLTVETHAKRGGVLEGVLNSPEPWTVLANAGATEAAFELADVLSQRGLHSQAIVASGIGWAAVQHRQAGEKYAGEHRYRQTLKEMLPRVSVPSQKAVIHYNTATSLVSSGFGAEAVAHYRQAALAEPGYLEQARWWSGMGGALFGRNCLRISRALYRRATELTGERRPLGLLGDIHFRLRDFRKASDLFGAWFNMNPELDAELMLKYIIAPMLEEQFGSGSRQVKGAYALAVSAYKEPEGKRQLALLKAALRLDPLCEYAWFNYAWLNSIDQPKSASAFWLIAATLTGRWDARAMVNAVAFLNGEKERTAQLAMFAVVFLANRWHGERFFLEVTRGVLPASPDHPVEAFVEHLRHIAEVAEAMFGKTWPRPS